MKVGRNLLITFCIIFILILSIYVYLLFDNRCIITENFTPIKIDDYFDEKYHKPYQYKQNKPNTIFISLASYRDKECENTLSEIFKKAKNPEKIFVGICQQNKEGDVGCVVDNSQFKNNVKYHDISYEEARGPTFARYLCSHLWDGEEYFLQIDSHTRFVPNWDEKIKDMYSKCPNRRCVLTHYPPDHSQYKDVKKGDVATHTCSSHFENNFHIISEARQINTKNKELYATPYVSAGFLFAPAEFLFDVPFDPYLPHLFQGEEVLLSSRLWTNGWDLYNLSEAVATHFYDRKNDPHFWDDHKNWTDTQNKTNKRYYYIIKQLEKKDLDKRFLYRVEDYGLGNKRTFEEWLEYTGIDLKNKKVISRCDHKYDIEKKKWIKLEK